MPEVEMYAAGWCPYCIRAKALLDRKGVDYRYIDVDKDPSARREMLQRGGGHTIPQIFIGGQPVGGSDEIHALDARGKLDALLAEAA